MAKARVSQKRTQLEKANSRMIATVAVAAFVVVFSVVTSFNLWKTMLHQARVINEKETARNQLEENLATVDELQVAYNAFIGTNQNVLGGDPKGSGDKDGDNAKLVLDALPSKYDFPGLTTSVEKVLKANGSNINSISGEDEEEIYSGEDQSNVGPVEMPFELSATGNYQSTQDLLSLLQRSIRPIQVQDLELSGTNSELVLNLTAVSYFQPERTLKVQTKVVK